MVVAELEVEVMKRWLYVLLPLWLLALWWWDRAEVAHDYDGVLQQVGAVLVALLPVVVVISEAQAHCRYWRLTTDFHSWLVWVVEAGLLLLHVEEAGVEVREHRGRR